MTFDDSTFGKLTFHAGRHRHPMHESEQVLQRKAAILCKYHAQVCRARLWPMGSLTTSAADIST